jgi:hypothetical protein
MVAGRDWFNVAVTWSFFQKLRPSLPQNPKISSSTLPFSYLLHPSKMQFDTTTYAMSQGLLSQGDMGKSSHQASYAEHAKADLFYSSSSYSDMNVTSPPEQCQDIDFFSYTRDNEFDDALFEVEMEICLEEFEEEDYEDDLFVDEFNSRLAVDESICYDYELSDHVSSHDYACESDEYDDDEYDQDDPMDSGMDAQKSIHSTAVSLSYIDDLESMLSAMDSPPSLDNDQDCYSSPDSLQTIPSPAPTVLADKDIPVTPFSRLTIV